MQGGSYQKKKKLKANRSRKSISPSLPRKEENKILMWMFVNHDTRIIYFVQ